MTKIRISLPRK